MCTSDICSQPLHSPKHSYLARGNIFPCACFDASVVGLRIWVSFYIISIIQPHPPQTICLFIRKQPGSYQSMGFSWHMYAGAVGLLCAARVCRFSNTLRQSPATPNLYIGIHKLAPSSVNVGKGFPKFAPPGVHFGTAGRKLTPAEPISDKKGVISDKNRVISGTQFPSDRCRGARFGKRVPTDRCTRRLFLQSCPVVHWAAAVSRISNSVACVKIRLHVIGLCSSSWSSVFRVVAFCFSCAREQFPEIAG